MHTLPKLEYPYDALLPYIDAKTMELHHSKHHQTYIDKLNAALEKYPELKEKELVDLLKNLDAIPEDIRTAVRNHGGGHYNHSLFWDSIGPSMSAGRPSDALRAAIEKYFTSFEDFQKKWNEMALALFGSGWIWLVQGGDKLTIITTPLQDTPLTIGVTPLLALDVWEHAYYLLYQNKRADYVSAWWNVVQWNKVNGRFK